MIYLTTNSDAGSTEGIGAMAQYQIFCYCLAKHLDVKYSFFGFKNLTHWQYYNVTQDMFDTDVNNFFNFPNETPANIQDFEKVSINNIDQNIYELVNTNRNLIINIAPIALMKYGQSNIGKIEKNDWLKQLRSNVLIDSTLTDSDYKQQSFNVAVHIRKYTKTDCDPSPIRDLYDDSKKEYYNKLVGSIYEKYKHENLKIHIYAQGTEDEYLFLKNDYVKLHIEEYPLISLYHMIKSDVLVMSNSSLSYIASLYRNNITYKKFNFYHTTYSNKMGLINPDGTII
jgi:hypothetical protein